MPLIWSEPYTIKQLMESFHSEDQPWPPSEKAVYLVSQRSWENHPTIECGPLYFGGNTGTSQRFCTRIGDLIADIFGFFDGDTGHHSGGQSLYWWCQETNTHPWSLHIAWATSAPWCARCAEIEVASNLIKEWAHRKEAGLLNKNRPPSCQVHGHSIG